MMGHVGAGGAAFTFLLVPEPFDVFYCDRELAVFTALPRVTGDLALV